MSHYSGTRDDVQDRDPATVPRLIDLRTIIGGMFTLYGIVLIVTSLVDKAPDLTKANGIRINLWLGLCMLALGLLFLLWVRLRPLRMEAPSAAAQAEGAHAEGANAEGAHAEGAHADGRQRLDAVGRGAPADESDTGPDGGRRGVDRRFER